MAQAGVGSRLISDSCLEFDNTTIEYLEKMWKKGAATGNEPMLKIYLALRLVEKLYVLLIQGGG